MTQIFVSEDEHAEAIGARKRYHWRERKTFKPGKSVKRRVVVIVKTPIFERTTYRQYFPSQKMFWYLNPRMYSEKWILECGHSILPPIRYDWQYGAPRDQKYQDPNEYEHLCNACASDSGEYIVERYKEYYWDYHTAENPHKREKCDECGACSICQIHIRNCKQPWREWLLELIWSDLGLVNFSDEEFARERSAVWDILRDLLSVMDTKKLKEVTSWYSEE